MNGYSPFLGQVPLRFGEVKYQPTAWRPALAQAPPAPAPAAPAAAPRSKTLPLVFTGVGALGGGVAAYSHYLRAGKKMNVWTAVASVFTAANLGVFGYFLFKE